MHELRAVDRLHEVRQQTSTFSDARLDKIKLRLEQVKVGSAESRDEKYVSARYNTTCPLGWYCCCSQATSTR
jgi:hypothetical protein